MHARDTKEEIESMPIRSRGYELLKKIVPLRKAVQGTRELLQRFRLPVWYVEGVGRAGESPMILVFAGHLQSKNYIVHLIFGETYSEHFLGTVWSSNVWRKGVRLGADLVVTHESIVSHKSRARSSGFCVPCWIGTEADLASAAARTRTSENIKSDIRRLNRNGLTYEITNDPLAIASFYSTMYVPYVQRVHGSRAMLTSWEEFAAELDRAELMLLKKDAETIAANLLVDLGNRRARARAMGVKDGEVAYVRMGAIAALYYFEVAHLNERGYLKVHYGASRPFLKDGVLRFKKKYGAKVVDHDSHIFRIRVARYSDGAKAFLRDNPFISESGGRYYANFFVDQSADSESGVLKDEISQNVIDGISATRIHAMDGARGVLDGGARISEPAVVELKLGTGQSASAS